MNTLSPFQKLVVTFLCASGAPWVVALIIDGLFFDNLIVMLGIGIALSVWTLKFGRQKNSELENSIGGIFGIMTGYIIPAGNSWWWPWPIGQALRKISVAKTVLERRVSSKNPFVAVKTRDGGTVEVGVVITYHVADARKSANYENEAELRKRADSLLDGSVRFYGLYWDSDESHDKREGTALSNRKVDFSKFLMGVKNLQDRDGNIIDNDSTERYEAMGIEIDSADVVDINEPPEVQKARNEAAAEPAQATREQRDAASLRARTLEIMWGTSDEVVIKRLKSEGIAPLVSSEDALTAARAAKGNLTEIRVSGNGGDFSKGAAIQATLSTQPKGRDK